MEKTLETALESWNEAVEAKQEKKARRAKRQHVPGRIKRPNFYNRHTPEQIEARKLLDQRRYDN